MADKKSAAARKKTAHKAEARKGKRARKAAPEPKSQARPAGNAEAPAAKVKRGEKQNAPKQAKKAVKAGEEEGEADELGEGVEPEADLALPDVGDDEELAADAEIDEDGDEDLAPPKKGSKATERKEVKDLLALGRDKGFLTYDEVNDALPSDIVSSDQIDDVMSMFGDNDIAIVDEANKVKLPETKPPEPEPVHAKAAEEEAEEKKEQEEEDNNPKPTDRGALNFRRLGPLPCSPRRAQGGMPSHIETAQRHLP